MTITIGGTGKLNDIRHFSMTRDSCRHATAECVKYCYGAHGNFLRPWVMKAYRENYEASKQEDFVLTMVSLLSNNERFFRIHAVGDFYNLEYIQKWCEIAVAKPHITFLAYTRNPDAIDYLGIPSNMRLIYTMDKSTDKSKMPMSKCRKAHVIDYSYKTAPHLSTSGTITVCNSLDCSNCLECWLGDTDIGFPQKYKCHNTESDPT